MVQIMDEKILIIIYTLLKMIVLLFGMIHKYMKNILLKWQKNLVKNIIHITVSQMVNFGDLVVVKNLH